jgi:1-acyl-sn-glycerol-3-phosphate acyltransferase
MLKARVSNSAATAFYPIARLAMRLLFLLTLRINVKNACDYQPGGYILACSHVSNLDPLCVSTLLSRRVCWMARIEFFRRGWSALLLRLVHAIPVNRQGVPVSAVRTALGLLGRGEVVGIFPEGEVKNGKGSVLRGGSIKRGACLLAARSGRPVVPCVVVGTERLNCVKPWIPFLRGRLWIIFGKPVGPVNGGNRRAARASMAAQIEAAFVGLYAELRRSFELDDNILP